MAAQDQDGRLGFADPVLVNSAAARLRPSGFAPLAQGAVTPRTRVTVENHRIEEFFFAGPLGEFIRDTDLECEEVEEAVEYLTAEGFATMRGGFVVRVG